ncbi:hypothetical protein COCON_G00235030 [Conger conger]|uniref:UBC core domain-containing protein n=1 Tax=Conger conger TaxID=82655 RepID=A0A9Q1CUK3_CONCO|nr:hypothetical protein COCON_G00235030 [Conger conger]
MKNPTVERTVKSCTFDHKQFFLQCTVGADNCFIGIIYFSFHFTHTHAHIHIPKYHLANSNVFVYVHQKFSLISLSGFWKILMSGPPDTPYEKGNFELYCQFGADYPLKPPQVRFLTPIHHCNVNSVGRICHNIFDRNYSANVTMKEILDSLFGLLIAAEPDDPLDSALHNAPKQTTEMSRERRILDELRSLHVDPHPYCTVFPSESDFSFWKILMSGPPDTPYEKGNFELYCQFGADYPLKPPQVRFLTPIHHCNVNSVGRICHNIFDRNYSANVTMKEILDSVFGLLIAAEPDDPLDSVVAEEFLSNPQAYVKQAEKTTVEAAGTSLEDMEKKLVGEVLSQVQIPRHLVCQLSGKMFIDPVSTKYGDVYERKCIEKALKMQMEDPFNKKHLRRTDLKPDKKMKAMVKEYRSLEISQPLSI